MNSDLSKPRYVFKAASISFRFQRHCKEEVTIHGNTGPGNFIFLDHITTGGPVYLEVSMPRGWEVRNVIRLINGGNEVELQHFLNKTICVYKD